MGRVEDVKSNSYENLNQPKNPSEDSLLVAEYISKMSGELSTMAANAGLPMLDYLLGMAKQEAADYVAKAKVIKRS